MKIRDGYLLRSVAGKNIVVPVGNDNELNKMLTLNDTGAFFWKLLQKGISSEELLEAVLREYEGASADEISKDIDEFITKLKDAKILED